MVTPPQHFCVRWNSYQSNLQNAFPKLLNSEHFVDVTLACENEMVKCHKVVLSACSAYFEKLLLDNPCQHPIIFMKDMKFQELQLLVDFMYKGEVNVMQTHLPSLLKSAEALQIWGLRCSDQLLNQQQFGSLKTQQQPSQAKSVPVSTNSDPKIPPNEVSKQTNAVAARKDDKPEGAGSKNELNNPLLSESESNNELSIKVEQEDLQEAVITEDDSYYEDDCDLMDTELSEDVKFDINDLNESYIYDNARESGSSPLAMTNSTEAPAPFATISPVLPTLPESDPLEIEEEPTTSTLSITLPSTKSTKEATASTSSSLPEISRDSYEMAHTRFAQWCDENKVESIDENVLLDYFKWKSKTHKSSTLWNIYSKLRSMLSLRKNIDISKYTNLLTFLKTQTKGYIAKKSEAFRRVDIVKFLKEADDCTFLMMKVALIIGIAGACRREELTNLLTDNVKDKGAYIEFNLTDTRTKRPKSKRFVVTEGNIEDLNLTEIIRKYISLRPPKTEHNRFFLGYRKGSCTRQPVGINTFGSMPKCIAKFLGLPKMDCYTGHCFRRSSLAHGGRIF